MKNLHKIGPQFTEDELATIWYLQIYSKVKTKYYGLNEFAWFDKYEGTKGIWAEYPATPDIRKMNSKLWKDNGKPDPHIEQLVK